jgi:hypothetical protein
MLKNGSNLKAKRGKETEREQTGEKMIKQYKEQMWFEYIHKMKLASTFSESRPSIKIKKQSTAANGIPSVLLVQGYHPNPPCGFRPKCPCKFVRATDIGSDSGISETRGTRSPTPDAASQWNC